MKKIIILFCIFLLILSGCATTESHLDKAKNPLDINNVLADIEKKESEKSMERIKYIAIGTTIGMSVGALLSFLAPKIKGIDRPLSELDIKIMILVILGLSVAGGYEGNLIYEAQYNEK